jgi:hypothetical protein
MAINFMMLRNFRNLFQSINANYLGKAVGLVIFIISPFNLFCQQVGEYEAKSAFLIKITNFVEWPETVLNQSTDFTIMILGESPIELILKRMKDDDTKIKNKKIVIKKASNIEEIKKCQILFISSSKKHDLTKILKSIDKLPVLTIGDTEGYSERGVMINMFVEKSIKFDVNKVNADLSGIYVSSKLLVHARNVIK